MGITALMYTTVELMVHLLNNYQRTKEQSPVFSPLRNRLIDLTNNLDIFNNKYTFSITNRIIIIIGLKVYNCY